ncbi:MAG: trypsin-like peptidase domain-containing protein [Thermoanaerobaculia bacterium]
MTARPVRRLHLAIALALTATTPLWGDVADLSKLVDQNAAALVTVQLVLQVKIPGAMGQILGDAQEFETETVCTVVDPKGLILCSNTQINGYTGMMQRLMGRMGAQADLTVTPTQIRVLAADPTKPLTAKILVRDTDLDLAWLQIENSAGQSFAYIDFARGAAPHIGDAIYAIRRLDKFFDRMPSLLEAKISSITQKPRALFIPTDRFDTSLGIPVLMADGQVVGLLVLQLPDEHGATERSGVSLEMMNWSSRMQDVGRGVILPAQEVVKATKRALASLAEKPAAKN